MKKELTELSMIAADFSAPDAVQGSGGNLSVKTGAGTMIIKASGMRFSELSPQKGFVEINYPMLAERYGKLAEPDRESGEKKEAEFLLSCRLAGGDFRPSMEAGFHAFLGKYVLHTHSVYANVLTCSAGGEELSANICSKLGFSSAFLGYFHPGAELAIAVAELVRERGIPEIIFLKNHGVIVSADSAERLADLHKKLDLEIKVQLGLSRYVPDVVGAGTHNFNFGKDIIFPDQAVFSVNGRGFNDYSPAEKELFGAWSYVLSSANNLGFQIELLPEAKVIYLRNMETEKHRKTMLI